METGAIECLTWGLKSNANRFRGHCTLVILIKNRRPMSVILPASAAGSEQKQITATAMMLSISGMMYYEERK